MRLNSALSVGATARDLIFTPRREKRPLTRAKTPNLFSNSWECYNVGSPIGYIPK